MFFPAASAFAAFAEAFYGAGLHSARAARVDFLTAFYGTLFGGCDAGPREAPGRRRTATATCEALADARLRADAGASCDGSGATVAHAVCLEYCFASQGVAAPYDVYAASPGAGVCAVDDLWIDLRRICPVKCGFCSQDQSMSCVAQAPPAPPTWSTHG